MQGKKKKPFNYQLFYRRTALIVYDIISVIAASYLAILIRYDFDVSTVPAAFLLRSATFCPSGLLSHCSYFICSVSITACGHLQARQSFKTL